MMTSPQSKPIQRSPADNKALFDKRRARDNRSHCCARGIVTDDQLRNFVDSQLNFYWMARSKLKSMKDQHCKDISELLGSKEWSKPDNDDRVRFRSHRGLTGLYSAVKGRVLRVVSQPERHFKISKRKLEAMSRWKKIKKPMMKEFGQW